MTMKKNRVARQHRRVVATTTTSLCSYNGPRVYIQRLYYSTRIILLYSVYSAYDIVLKYALAVVSGRGTWLLLFSANYYYYYCDDRLRRTKGDLYIILL